MERICHIIYGKPCASPVGMATTALSSLSVFFCARHCILGNERGRSASSKTFTFPYSLCQLFSLTFILPILSILPINIMKLQQVCTAVHRLLLTPLIPSLSMFISSVAAQTTSQCTSYPGGICFVGPPTLKTTA